MSEAAVKPNPAAPSLAVRHLSKAFGGVQAVRDVSFDLGKGELLALIGPNGAGKSTCFNMLNGQIRADSGSVSLAGTELIGRSPADIWRRGVGRTFQITATFPSMTVAENVAMVLMSQRHELFSFLKTAVQRHRKKALELLDLVGMTGQADRPCGVLSYGDLKRVELAVALGNEPSVLLMDEPTAGMAPRERIELMGLAARLVRDLGLSVLFTEHDMDIVFGHADRIIVLSRGELIAEGTAEQIRSNPLVLKTYLGEGQIYGRKEG